MGRIEASSGHVFCGPNTRDFDRLIRKNNSLGEYLLNKLKNEHAEDTLMTDFSTSLSYTGGQLYECIMNASTAFVELLQVRPGDTACISSRNSAEQHIMAISLICAGATVACLSYKDPYPELLNLAKKIDPKLLLCSRNDCAKLAEQLGNDLGHQVQAVAMEGASGDGGEMHCFAQLVQFDRSKSQTSIPVRIEDIYKHVALVKGTTGTTGPPKLVPCTHYNCLSVFYSANASNDEILQKGTTFPCSSSLDYISGRLLVFGAIDRGLHVILLPGFDPETYARAIEKHRSVASFLGAAAFLKFITWPRLGEFDISSLKMVFPMGAKVVYHRELAQFFKTYPNVIKVYQGYGGSEFSGCSSTSCKPELYLSQSDNCGRLSEGFRVKLFDPASGQQIDQPNRVGLIHLKSASTFPGYYQRDGFLADESVFDKEGFYKTGDLAYFNQKEELIFVGRQREVMCCRSSKKVLPQELEVILEKHPAVEMVCVMAAHGPKNKLLDCPRAFVQPKREFYERVELIDQLSQLDSRRYDEKPTVSGNANTQLCSLARESRRKLAAELKVFLNKQVSWDKQLTGGVVLLDQIPVARTGKVDKGYLRSLTLDQMEVYGDQSE